MALTTDNVVEKFNKDMKYSYFSVRVTVVLSIHFSFAFRSK